MTPAERDHRRRELAAFGDALVLAILGRDRYEALCRAAARTGIAGKLKGLADEIAARRGRK